MSVQHTRLGRHGVLVSRLCLGTMNFGWHTRREEAFAIMDRALELGINFFDTADVYGWSATHGETERILGEWFALGEGRRDAVVLATKVYNTMEGAYTRREPNSDCPGLSAYKIRKHCEASLKRLRTEHIDLYQMHHIDRDCPWGETWQAFNALVQQGKIVYVGSSNFAGWDIATACQEASRRGFAGLVSEQSTYHLDNRMVELEVIPACRHYGLGLIPWSPLGGGLLGGALAWLLHSPVVTAPIIGPRTLAQLESAVRATEVRFDDGTLAALDEIFPGPGGEAPKAYAW